MRVAFVGKPNVGKSTLFNRLIGQKKAIESDLPGTTRDKHEHLLVLEGYPLLFVDTGGIDIGSGRELAEEITRQTMYAVEEADMLVFVVDGRQDPTFEDVRIADMLRRSGKPCLLAVNKLDTPELSQRTYEFYSLGFDPVLGISSYHKKGLRELVLALIDTGKQLGLIQSVKNPEIELYEDVLEDEDAQMVQQAAAQVLYTADDDGSFDELEEIDWDSDSDADTIGAAEQEEPVTIMPYEDKEGNFAKVTIIGRPNVGKSTLFNQLVGKNMSLVSTVAGTTRDAIDTVVSLQSGEKIVLVDTAGVRRRGSIQKGVEKYSVMRMQRAVERSDIVLVVLDAKEGLVAQDQHVLQMALEQKKGIILVVNKWDLLESPGDDKIFHEYVAILRRQLKYAPWISVLCVSAETGKRVSKIWDLIRSVRFEQQKRVSTGALNALVKAVMINNPPTGPKTFFPKLYYGSQIAVNPPEFVFFVNDPDAFHFSWIRFLDNKIREAFGFEGTSLRFIFKGRNPWGRNRIKEPDVTGLERASYREARERLRAEKLVERVF